MTLQMFDVEIDGAELEDFSPPACDSDVQIEIVEVVALEEEETPELIAPLRGFWDCPPLALAGILCAVISFTGVVLFYGLIVAFTFRLPLFR